MLLATAVHWETPLGGCPEEVTMADCEKLQTCPFFKDQMAQMPSVARLMKTTFCHGDKMDCARYQVFMSGGPVPADLLPNDVDRAHQILSQR
jgi:hypothetical protein